METATEIRTPANRVRNWTGTVHYAENGVPSCGSALTSAYLTPTVATVTCARCITQYGADTPGHTDPVVEYHADDHAARRAAERAARRAAR
jgi:hypothetical protein